MVSARLVKRYRQGKGFIEREFVNVGATSSGYPPVGWAKKRGSVYSNAYDNLFQEPPRKKLRIRQDIPKLRRRSGIMPLRRRYGGYRRKYAGRAGYRRRTYRRKTYGRRRTRSSWGSRVRRAAIKTSESKRLVANITQDLDDVSADITSLARIPSGGSTSTGLQTKNQRAGIAVWTTGFRLDMSFQNLQTQPLIARVTIGYKKYNRSLTENFSIFKEPTDEANVSLNDITAYHEKMIAMVDNKEYKKMRDFSVFLAGNDAVETGADSRNLKVWIPWKKMIKFDSAATGNVSQTYDPQVHVYVYNKEGVALTTPIDCCRFQMRAVTYFRDP